MIDDGEVTEDESLALPRLTRRERRLTKDDLRLVRAHTKGLRGGSRAPSECAWANKGRPRGCAEGASHHQSVPGRRRDDRGAARREQGTD